MEKCIFCQIIAHKIPAHIIHEDEQSLAFLDIFPFTDGHTLLIPKDHHSNIHELPEKTAAHLHTIAQKISHQLTTKLNYPGTTLLQNNGSTQDVPHYHIHIIGRHAKNTLTIKSADEANKTNNTPEYLQMVKKQLLN